jgi:hypothetical protein
MPVIASLEGHSGVIETSSIAISLDRDLRIPGQRAVIDAYGLHKQQLFELGGRLGGGDFHARKVTSEDLVDLRRLRPR